MKNTGPILLLIGFFGPLFALIGWQAYLHWNDPDPAISAVQKANEEVQHNLPVGCVLHNLGRWNGEIPVLVVVCNGRVTTSSNYMTWSGKFRRRWTAIVIQ